MDGAATTGQTIDLTRALADRAAALTYDELPTGVRDVQLYMRTPQTVEANAALLRADFPGARVCFFGHSHFQKVYEVHDAGGAQAGGLDRLGHGLQYNCNLAVLLHHCSWGAHDGTTAGRHPPR